MSAQLKVAYNLPEAAAVTPLSVTTLRKAIHTGDLKAKKYGRAYIIRDEDLREFLRNLPDAD